MFFCKKMFEQKSPKLKHYQYTRLINPKTINSKKIIFHILIVIAYEIRKVYGRSELLNQEKLINQPTCFCPKKTQEIP